MAGEDEEADANIDRVEKEVGPPLLTPLSEDASLESMPAWTVRSSSLCIPETAVAIVRSSLWPGAYALSAGK